VPHITLISQLGSFEAVSEAPIILHQVQSFKTSAYQEKNALLWDSYMMMQ